MTEPAEIVAKLAALYPKTFFLEQRDRRPLKLHIDREIKAATDLSWHRLRIALAWYTRGFGYLSNSIEDAARIDLTGEPAGTVTADQAAHAREQLAQYSKAKTKHPPTQAAAPAPAPRSSLADLRAAAKARQQLAASAIVRTASQ